jgi:hypothetical protein
MARIPRAGPRLGCLGSLVFSLGVVLALYAIIAPWSFHIGGRWTLPMWSGVGRLRDSAGAQYGLYVYFYPTFSGASRLGNEPFPRVGLRGQSWVCTAGGAKYPLRLSGQISGAWLNTDGALMSLSMSEPRGPKLRRAFNLYGAWRGENLVLDDHKSMFIHFRPDGTLTPSGSYTSPVPEKHATVTLASGTLSDFESTCAALRGQ